MANRKSHGWTSETSASNSSEKFSAPFFTKLFLKKLWLIVSDKIVLSPPVLEPVTSGLDATQKLLGVLSDSISRVSRTMQTPAGRPCAQIDLIYMQAFHTGISSHDDDERTNEFEERETFFGIATSISVTWSMAKLNVAQIFQLLPKK